MEMNRREFMRNVGVVMASLLTSSCATCYAPLLPRLTPTAGADGDWNRLRRPWLDLDRLAQDAQDNERGPKTLERLTAEHRAALDDLVKTGQLDPALAQDMQVAFEGAANHVWRANAPITCYAPAPYPEYGIQSAADLARQADILTEMAQGGAIQEATVAQARSAIERDVAFLSMSADEQQAILDAVVKAAGDSHNFPALEELDFDVAPEAVEAARLLVELLLGKQ